MKKIITLLLSLAMILSLCACGNSGNAEQTDAGQAEGLQVGYAKINITPNYTVGLGGYSDAETRSSEGFVDYIYSTCIAITDREETILVYTIDNCSAGLSIQQKLRQTVSAATGISEEKIFIGATHGHNCPSLTNYGNAAKYREDFYAGALEAAQKALADRSPATLLRAKADHEGMNFVRHYTLIDGTYTDSSGASAAGADKLVGHPMPTDPQMVMLKFDRADESKKDILMVNWQAHPDSASEIGYKVISPSWIGPMRNKLEKQTGMHVAYFTGASGNQTKESKIPSETNGYTWSEYGEALADCAFSMIESLEPVEGTAIKTTRVTMEVDVDHSWDHMLAQANEVYDLWKSAGKTAGDALAKTYGMSSSYQARAIRSRAAMSKTVDLELNAFSVGGIGFTTGTYEMFSDNALFVKEHSPFETTFVITGCSGYIPSDIAYTYRGYEADTGMYARGVGEKLADKYVELLTQIK